MLERLRQTARGRDLPIIAVTTQDQPGDRERCFAVGMDGYVPKPVRAETLASEIRRVFADRRARAERRAGPQVPLWSVVSLEQLRQLASSRPDFVTEVIDLYRSDSARILAALGAAVAAGDAKQISSLVHELVGASNSVGAARVAADAQALSALARADADADASAPLDALRQLERTRALTLDAFAEQFAARG